MLFICVISIVSAAWVCTEHTKLTSTLFFFRSAVWTGLLLFPLLSMVTDSSLASFLEPRAPGSWHSIHWREKKKQIEQMFLTLCVMLPPPILLLGYVVRG